MSGPTPEPDFHPHPALRHAQVMTIVPRLLARPTLLTGIPVEARLFSVAPGAQLLGYCHWQPTPQACPTAVLVHGLEGSSESHYMRGLAHKAWHRGWNVIRLNQRNCGRSEHLSRTLYHSGLSDDIRAVLQALSTKHELTRIWAVGYSMGGNLVLRMAGHVGASLPVLQGVIAVCPTIDPAACVTALEQPANWLFQRHFVRRLKQRLRRKARLFPGRWDVRHLADLRTIREFDDRYTAPDGGFDSATDYYERSGARHILHLIDVPTLMLTAQDDPFVPFTMFAHPTIAQNPRVTVWAPRFGGHCGFIQRRHAMEDRYWAENRIMDVLLTWANVSLSESAARGSRTRSEPEGFAASG